MGMEYQFFLMNPRYIMLGAAIIAAIATSPPNASTMLKFLAAMVALYVLLLLVRRCRRLS